MPSCGRSTPGMKQSSAAIQSRMAKKLNRLRSNLNYQGSRRERCKTLPSVVDADGGCASAEVRPLMRSLWSSKADLFLSEIDVGRQGRLLLGAGDDFEHAAGTALLPGISSRIAGSSEAMRCKSCKCCGRLFRRRGEQQERC